MTTSATPTLDLRPERRRLIRGTGRQVVTVEAATPPESIPQALCDALPEAAGGGLPVRLLFDDGDVLATLFRLDVSVEAYTVRESELYFFADPRHPIHTGIDRRLPTGAKGVTWTLDLEPADPADRLS